MQRHITQKGFTLVETLSAIAILTVGLSATSGLLVSCYRQEKLASDLALSNAYARSKIEELEHSGRVPGGSTDVDVASYSDHPLPSYTRRWQIVGESSGTDLVTVVMVPNQSGMAQSSLSTRMR